MRFSARLLAGTLAAAALAFPGPQVAAIEDTGAKRPSADGFCPGSIRWQVAENYVGHRRSVRGPVRSAVFASGSRGRPTFLNVGRPYPSPERFAVVIWGRFRNRFPSPPERLYGGEYICVRGRIRLFDGVPETFLSGPGAIDVRGES
jgi:hypothetical protein